MKRNIYRYLTSYQDTDGLWYAGGPVFAFGRLDADFVMEDIKALMGVNGMSVVDMRIDGFYEAEMEVMEDISENYISRNCIIGNLFLYSQIEFIHHHRCLENMDGILDSMLACFEANEMYEYCGKIINTLKK